MHSIHLWRNQASDGGCKLKVKPDRRVLSLDRGRRNQDKAGLALWWPYADTCLVRSRLYWFTYYDIDSLLIQYLSWIYFIHPFYIILSFRLTVFGLFISCLNITLTAIIHFIIHIGVFCIFCSSRTSAIQTNHIINLSTSHIIRIRTETSHFGTRSKIGRLIVEVLVFIVVCCDFVYFIWFISICES